MAHIDNCTAFHLYTILGGAQKAGTTTLYRYLAAHPQLAAPSRKETHFFDNETIDWDKPDYGILKAFYPTKMGERLAFDATPIYLYWPPSLARIRDHNSDIRLIFLFRDPIERAWSHWRMETSRDAESLPFASAIRDGRQRLNGRNPLDPAWRVFSYVERGYYAAQVQRLLSLFTREQVLFLTLSNLKRDRDAVLRRVSEFLGIAPFPSLPVYHERRSDAPSMQEEDICYLRDIFREDVIEFSKISGVCVEDWLTVRDE